MNGLEQMPEFETWKPEHRPYVERVANAVVDWIRDETRKSSLLVEIPAEAVFLIPTMCDALYSVGLPSYIEDDTHIRIVRFCFCAIIE